VLAACAAGQVVVISGETGCGKTTQARGSVALARCAAAHPLYASCLI
jgi:HrpA-like RNA helicase